MGVIRWLDRIDPRIWDAAVERVAREGEALLETGAAREFLLAFGREPSPELLDTLADAEDESIRPTLLNNLLETAVREQEWYLDKALNQLELVSRALPGGEVLLDIIDFRGIDVEPPRDAGAIEGGLFGCLSPKRLERSASLIRDLAGVEEVAAAIRARKPGLLARLGGGSARAEAAAAVLCDEYHSQYWSELREAVLTTFGLRHYLGLGMSP
jgi:hypothetical protein